MITIFYFAGLREQLGKASEHMQCPDGVSTLGELRAYLGARGEPWSTVLGPDVHLMMSLNQVLAEAENTLKDGDEIAYFPPVTGG